MPADSVADTTAVAPVAKAATTNLSSAKLAFESRWLSLARWYDKLITDLEEEVESKTADVLVWVSDYSSFWTS